MAGNLNQMEALFRSSLEDVITFLERVGPSCNSLDEILDVARLATINDGQLRMLMKSCNELHRDKPVVK